MLQDPPIHDNKKLNSYIRRNTSSRPFQSLPLYATTARVQAITLWKRPQAGELPKAV